MSTPPAGAKSSSATRAFVVGIVGAVCCQLAAPAAWFLGARELKAIRAGRSDAAGKGFALAGMILGIVGTGLLLVSLLILPAILIPNFLDATEKAKQRRTVADLRTLGVALFAYCADQTEPDSCYPEAASAEELAAALVPDYLAAPITLDGWKHPIQYRCRPEAGGSGCAHAVLRSPGRDGDFEFDDVADYPSGGFAAREVDRDIVWADGEFLRFPEVGPPAPESGSP